MKTSGRLVLYISMSLDGFISTIDDNIDWLNRYAIEGEDYGYEEFTKNVDSYIVGRKTYEVVLNLTGGVFPPASKFTCYVITREERLPENGIVFYNGSIATLISKLKSESSHNIYCDGGGEIVKMLMDEDLIDEYIISVIPILLGDGKRLFRGSKNMTDLNLIGCQDYASGLVQLRYSRK